MKKIFFIFCLVGVLFASEPIVLYLGKTYKFKEKDLLIAIHQYIEKNKDKIKQKIEKLRENAKQDIKNFKPKGLIPLTPALKNRVFYPDMNYTLDRDITDIEGRIIYPKGFTFNPLKYAKLSYGIVVINGNNRREVEWFKKSKYANTIAYRLFISDGSYYKLIKELNQPVFYCLPKIVKRFHLKHTPSVIIQRGEKMEVREICLTCKDKDKK